jgi:hypothetical protein
MHPFEAYLQRYQLNALTLSIVAAVRYLTVYNAMKGIPIPSERAQRIRHAVLGMSGVPFTGGFVLTEPEPTNRLPTIPIKKFPNRSL